MFHSDAEYAKHIMEEIEVVERSIEGKNKAEVVDDDILSRAVVRSIEVIGEAVKKLSPEAKAKYPDIPWKNIAGTRDHLIHAYFAVDMDIVWDIIQNKFPEIKPAIHEIIHQNLKP